MNSHSHTKRQHYVPQFLLRNFSTNSKTVYVWDRRKEKGFSTSLDNICYETDLYEVKWRNNKPELGEYILDNKIEKEFSILEGKTATLFKDISQKIKTSNKILLSENQKEVLIEFITTLYLRNPVKMAEIKAQYDDVDTEPQMSTNRV